MLRDALLVAGKDLTLERRSRVTTNQIAPLALLVLIVFAFALDARSRRCFDVGDGAVRRVRREFAQRLLLFGGVVSRTRNTRRSICARAFEQALEFVFRRD